MRKKYIILLTLMVLIIITFTAGIAYSFFNSHTTMSSNNESIAKFIFETELKDNVELPIVDITPDKKENYEFQVKNTLNDKKADVSINYQITINTYHFLPTVINLYRDNELVMVCDESYSRNDSNELICNSEIMKMDYKEENIHDYKIEVGYEDGFDDLMYKDLVDYIDISIKSWQIIE